MSVVCRYCVRFLFCAAMSGRARATLAAAFAVAGGSVGYAHYSQFDERRRMHAGVLRDIALEEAERLRGAGGVGGASVVQGECANPDVCSLAQRRFREPGAPDEARAPAS